VTSKVEVMAEGFWERSRVKVRVSGVVAAGVRPALR
jgi:hypothetical protein